MGRDQQHILQGSYCLSRGPCSSMEIESTCDFQWWESEPQVGGLVIDSVFYRGPRLLPVQGSLQFYGN